MIIVLLIQEASFVTLKASDRPFQGDKTTFRSMSYTHGVKSNTTINVLFVQVLF
jgi:hypothetical protein